MRHHGMFGAPSLTELREPVQPAETGQTEDQIQQMGATVIQLESKRVKPQEQGEIA